MEPDELRQHLCTATEAEKQTLRRQLEAYINDLINTDFSRLVQLLYTVDVDEQKLKQALHAQPDRDAAPLMAELILARLQEKTQSRQQFTSKATPDDEERW